MPISPDDALIKKLELIPDYVFEAFDEMIVNNLTLQKSARFEQDKLIALIIKKSGGTLASADVFNRRMLDVIPDYTKAGWTVKIESGDYREDCGTCYFFCKK